MSKSWGRSPKCQTNLIIQSKDTLRNAEDFLRVLAILLEKCLLLLQVAEQIKGKAETEGARRRLFKSLFDLHTAEF